MTTEAIRQERGRARYAFRVRISSTARRALEAEWDRCRWIWNECVAKPESADPHNRASGGETRCGPVQLAKALVEPAR